MLFSWESHTHETSTKKTANSSQHTQDSAANTDAEGKAASSPVEHGARQVGQPQPPQLLGGVQLVLVLLRQGEAQGDRDGEGQGNCWESSCSG